MPIWFTLPASGGLTELRRGRQDYVNMHGTQRQHRRSTSFNAGRSVGFERQRAPPRPRSPPRPPRTPVFDHRRGRGIIDRPHAHPRARSVVMIREMARPCEPKGNKDARETGRERGHHHHQQEHRAPKVSQGVNVTAGAKDTHRQQGHRAPNVSHGVNVTAGAKDNNRLGKLPEIRRGETSRSKGINMKDDVKEVKGKGKARECGPAFPSLLRLYDPSRNDIKVNNGFFKDVKGKGKAKESGRASPLLMRWDGPYKDFKVNNGIVKDVKDKGKAKETANTFALRFIPVPPPNDLKVNNGVVKDVKGKGKAKETTTTRAPQSGPVEWDDPFSKDSKANRGVVKEHSSKKHVAEATEEQGVVGQLTKMERKLSAIECTMKLVLDSRVATGSKKENEPSDDKISKMQDKIEGMEDMLKAVLGKLTIKEAENNNADASRLTKVETELGDIEAALNNSLADLSTKDDANEAVGVPRSKDNELRDIEAALKNSLADLSAKEDANEAVGVPLPKDNELRDIEAALTNSLDNLTAKDEVKEAVGVPLPKDNELDATPWDQNKVLFASDLSEVSLDATSWDQNKVVFASDLSEVSLESSEPDWDLLTPEPSEDGQERLVEALDDDLYGVSDNEGGQ